MIPYLILWESIIHFSEILFMYDFWTLIIWVYIQALRKDFIGSENKELHIVLLERCWLGITKENWDSKFVQ